jgi:hypothetical protein
MLTTSNKVGNKCGFGGENSVAREDSTEVTNVHKLFVIFMNGLMVFLMWKIAGQIFRLFDKVGMVAGDDGKESIIAIAIGMGDVQYAH